MNQTTHSATRKMRQIPDLPTGAADKSNPITHGRGAKPARQDRPRASSELSLEDQRRALLALRARLRGNVLQTADTALSGTVETTNASPDTADLASEIVEQDLAVSLLGSTMGTLDQIDAALEQIESGSYGRCAECEARIPNARLEAIPYARCCVECASRQERAA